MKHALWLAVVLSVASAAPAGVATENSAFAQALELGERLIASGDLVKARAQIDRALERDAKSPRAWGLRARWAEKAGDRDELVYALHTELRLMVAQKAAKDRVAALRERLLGLDEVAIALLGMNTRFIKELEPVAAAYEKEGRPHSAIRVHKQILALDPEYPSSLAAIERISALPDPSLAGDAKPKDLLADISDEWIREHDAEHATWEKRAKLERENYTTYTNAGYAVLVRAAEAMEQMNGFYREFFQYATEEEGGSVPRIDLNIFDKRDEYLKLGQGPPVEWSGGHFTDSAVETYVEGGGFEGMTQTLFHEAAHQFVSLATNAAGWLNEGIASFFEGCRILPNGTVLMNMPASGRLFDLATRMDKGWMSSASDGIDPKEPSKSSPEKAPSFRIVLENEYEWGPPWYAPTWGVVFFLYNYQDPVDGRFVYRPSFRTYVDSSGGRIGKGAIKNFEEVVLANPAPPIKGVDRKDVVQIALPKTVDELNEVWRTWMLELRDEQAGTNDKKRPYLHWARCALLAKNFSAAQEHFEKGLVTTPDDIELLTEFSDYLARAKNTDRASKLLFEALRVLQTREPRDETAIKLIERLLAKYDNKRATLERVQREIAETAHGIVERYRDAKLPLMVMDVSSRLGRDLNIPALFELYADAARASGKSLHLWQLAYNEENLDGWDSAGESFTSNGMFLEAKFGAYAANVFDYQVLGLDRLTGGDYSLEAEIQAESGAVSFCGLAFGRKNASTFHGFVYFPPKAREEGSALASSAFVDLASFFGGTTAPKTWRHNAVETVIVKKDESATDEWHKLRIDVAGPLVDAWFDGELVASQEFASPDVLRGTFGLVISKGTARFKEVRFLARDPRDPTGKLERALLMERIKQEGGGAIGGSWLGQVPPWPKVARWAQGERANWLEKGPVPQLLVLWSIQQNDLIAIDGWLTDFAARFASYGVEIVSVASPNDGGAIDEYLKAHPFPGAVGVDFREGPGIGDSNKMFFTMRFNLPRVLLLDIDGTVVWEGDPGFSAAEPWRAGVESFVDLPLRELIAKRKLDKLMPWLEAWTKAEVQLHAGELASAFATLAQAREFDASSLGQVRDAQAKLAAFEDALANLADVGAELGKQQREPALAVLLGWAKSAGKEPDKRALASLKSHLAAATNEHWARALKQLEGYRAKVEKDPAIAAELTTKLTTLKGTFVAELVENIRSAGSDRAALLGVLDAAPNLPSQWLAQTYFGW